MQVTIKIKGHDGRDALPIRAIPFVTGWEMPPDKVAAVLAHDDFLFQTIIKREPIALTAYHLDDGTPHPMLPMEWNSVLRTLNAKSSNLVASAWDTAAQIARPQPVRDTKPLPEMGLPEWLKLSPWEREQLLLRSCDDDDPKANIRDKAYELTGDQWQREAVEILPSGVFVWRDDFERVYASILLGDEKPGHRELNFSPWVPEESRHAVMAGFSVQDPPAAAPEALPPADAAAVEAPTDEQVKTKAAFDEQDDVLPTAKDGEPCLRNGRNNRAKVAAWVAWQARNFAKLAETETTVDVIAEEIYLEAQRWGYESERKEMTISSIVKMIPPGLTGGRSKSPGAPKK